MGALPLCPHQSLPAPNLSSRNLASCECREKPSRSLRRHHCSMWPPRRMRHLLRRASSSLRFSRRRRDASATGEAMRAQVCGRTWCRRGVPGKHSPSSVCTEWGPEHTASKALATLGSSHPFLELGWDLGYRGRRQGQETSTGKFVLLVPGLWGLRAAVPRPLHCCPCKGRPAPHCLGTGPAHARVLPARPNPPSPRLRVRLPVPRALSASRGRTGAHRARRRYFSFKKKLRRNSPLRRRRLQTDLQREAKGLRLRAVRPTQSLPGIVVSPRPECLSGEPDVVNCSFLC